MLPHEFRRDLYFGISSQKHYQPDPSDSRDCKKSVYPPYNILSHKDGCQDKYQLNAECIEPVLEDPVRTVVKEVDIFNKADRAAEQHVQKQQVQVRNVAAHMEYREVAL